MFLGALLANLPWICRAGLCRGCPLSVHEGAGIQQPEPQARRLAFLSASV